MSQRYLGGIVTASPTAPTTTTASGEWTLTQQLQYNSTWPKSSTSQIAGSLRFRSSASAYLSRTPSVTSNQKTWTWSGWVKRGALSVGGDIFGTVYTSGGTNDQTYLRLESNDKIGFVIYDTAGGYNALFATTSVYRDPAAWYHIVLALDTTQATSTNRVKLYVNGIQITSFTSSTYPSQNKDGYVNLSGRQVGIGNTPPTGATYFDGYLAEINFIDGQQLDPSYFGYTDSNGIWQASAYTGTYGTNGFYLPFNVDKTRYSYAFNTTPSYLTSTTAGIMPLGNTTWSIECWTWCNVVPTANVSFIANTASGGLQIFYRPAINTVEIGAYGVADVAPASVTVNNLLLNAWNHFVFTSNGTQLRIFANGILIGYLSSSYSFAASQGTVYIGTNDTTSSQTLNGFISNLRVCNGSIPTSYQTSSTTISASIFTPPTTALTTTSQGAANVTLLTCQSSTIVDNSSSPKTLVMTGTVSPSNIGFNSNPFYDQSPNGNNWTPNNISLVNGSTCDSMVDSPTVSSSASNYCVWNPINIETSTTISEANLKFLCSSGASYNTCTGTISVSSGKWYWELTYTGASGDGSQTGILASTRNLAGLTTSAATGTWSDGYAYSSNGNKVNNGSGSAYGSTYTTGDVIGVALDLDAGTLVFYKNNTSQGTAYSSLSGSFVPSAGSFNSNYYQANFGQRPFTYTPPTGFVALNTYNLPASTITNGAAYMAATTYTGNGGTLAVSNAVNGVSFQPDLVWIKMRSGAAGNELFDSIRGANIVLYSNATNAEANVGTMSTFGSGGFTAVYQASDVSTNNNGSTFVGWQWKAGGTSSSNTNGSITSTVSVGATQGFSVVTFTAQTSGTATVGHGLGVAPSMIITKVRNGTSNWASYHTSLGNTQYIELNTTTAAQTLSTAWNNTSPTSTVFTLGSAFAAASQTMVAYCFAAVKGFSAFGSYTGNGSADGPFVYLGFRPRFIITKSYDATAGIGDWTIHDTSRLPYNTNDLRLFANASSAESTGEAMDMLSNGFKIRATNSNCNTSGGGYIYMAFAENPFNLSRAR